MLLQSEGVREQRGRLRHSGNSVVGLLRCALALYVGVVIVRVLVSAVLDVDVLALWLASYGARFLELLVPFLLQELTRPRLPLLGVEVRALVVCARVGVLPLLSLEARALEGDL